MLNIDEKFFNPNGVMFMPFIIGPFTVKNQTGGKFNFGNVFFSADKNNMHLEGRASSYNQGSLNNQTSLTNNPTLTFNGISIAPDIVDSDLIDSQRAI